MLLVSHDRAPRVRTRVLAAVITTAVVITAALSTVTDVAAASTSARADGTTTVHASRRTHAKARAHTRAHARLHAKRLRAELHAHLRTRTHARLHAHRGALASVAGAGRADVSTGGASLRGSHEAVDRAYDEAVREGLPFVHSEDELERRARGGEYIALARSTATYQLKGVGSPYVRPATHAFVTSFAADYARTCGEPLTVTSAMRPTTIRLRNSVEKSVHPTGMAVDLRASRTGCRAWMRTTLLDLERQGVIDATEEHHPVHFHVVVLRAP